MVQRVRRELDAENFAGARAELPALHQLIEQSSITPGADRSAERALRELEEGTGGDAYWRQPTWKRLVVIAAGPLANVVVAFVIFFAVFATRRADRRPEHRGGRGRAARSGRGRRPAAGRSGHRGRRAAHRDLRGGVAADPREPREADHGDGRPRWHHGQLGPKKTIEQGGRYIWGFVPTAKLVSYGAGTSLRKSGSELWTITTGTGTAIGGLFHARERKQLTGTVGIVKASATALKIGLPYYLEILGLVSMSLALLNLLPLLPLDGGHIAVSLIEGIRRRALAARSVRARLADRHRHRPLRRLHRAEQRPDPRRRLTGVTRM